MNEVIVIVGCVLATTATTALAQVAKFDVSSTAFSPGKSIPTKYTCQGEDVSPPLRWDGAPTATKTFALICDDPDAPGGVWVHWVLYNLPGNVHALPENTPKTAGLPDGAKQGANSFNHTGYGGPCPPPGKAHRYYFKIYALDTDLSLPGAPEKESLLHAMQGHILAQGELMGRYQRR